MTSTAPTSRPALPISRLNPHLTAIPSDNLIVKYQTIVREGNEIIVGRVKVPTPEGHAFILRRYDTGAFSLTTMFKATFPGATDVEEKTECDWVKGTFDNAGANGGKSSTDVRLAGSWVVADIALFIADDYGISEPVAALASAFPDPGMQYRKSQRSQAAAAMDSNTPKKAASAVPTKKVKTDSSSTTEPAASLSTLANGLPVPIPSPSKAAADLESRIKRDLQAGKDLVAKIKKETEERAAASLKAAEEKGEVVAEEVKKVVKRAFEVEEDVKEAVAGAVGAKKEDEGVLEEGRAIATNRRAEVPVGRAMQTVKQAAWGAFVFGLGIGATTILPRFFF